MALPWGEAVFDRDGTYASTGPPLGAAYGLLFSGEVVVVRCTGGYAANRGTGGLAAGGGHATKGFTAGAAVGLGVYVKRSPAGTEDIKGVNCPLAESLLYSSSAGEFVSSAREICGWFGVCDIVVSDTRAPDSFCCSN